jgi:hypothetical protein
MKGTIFLLSLLVCFSCANSQTMSLAQMKTELENSSNAPLYAKQVLKRRIKIDTISVSRIGTYGSLADSLAYTAKLKKVYGPYGKPGSRFLVQVLARAPNTFYRFSQIYLDTSVFRHRVADSLGRSILSRIREGKDSFEHLAQTYSMGGEAATKGDLGWVALGILIPEIAHELIKKKKGDVFIVWSRKGLHIIKKTEDPKQDTGFALMMRIFL